MHRALEDGRRLPVRRRPRVRRRARGTRRLRRGLRGGERARCRRDGRRARRGRAAASARRGGRCSSPGRTSWSSGMPAASAWMSHVQRRWCGMSKLWTCGGLWTAGPAVGRPERRTPLGRDRAAEALVGMPPPGLDTHFRLMVTRSGPAVAGCRAPRSTTRPRPAPRRTQTIIRRASGRLVYSVIMRWWPNWYFRRATGTSRVSRASPTPVRYLVDADAVAFHASASTAFQIISTSRRSVVSVIHGRRTRRERETMCAACTAAAARVGCGRSRSAAGFTGAASPTTWPGVGVRSP